MEAAKVKIAWTRKASRHLRDAYNFWADERSLRDARIMLDRIFATVEVLEKFPEAGRRGRIAGMRERLSLIGGTLEIESSEGNGTTVFARIPIEPSEPA